MEPTKFFGVRRARGAAHLVVPDLPKPVAETKPKRAPRKASTTRKKKAPKVEESKQQSLAQVESKPAPLPQQAIDHRHVKSTNEVPPSDEAFADPNYCNTLVGYFDAEESNPCVLH